MRCKVVIGTLFAVLMVESAYADTAREDTEMLRTAGEIDSSRVEHIQALLDSLAMKMAREDGTRIDKDKDKRVSQKLSSGTLTGLLVGTAGGLAAFALGDKDCSDDVGDLNFVCAEAARAVIIGLFVYPVGVTVGVHRVDSHDRFIPTLAGSVAGFLAGAYLLDPVLVLLGPPVLSTFASEVWRKPPDSHGFSLGLAPDHRGGLSAVATLRF